MSSVRSPSDNTTGFELVIIEPPEFDFEIPHPDAVAIEPLLHKAQKFLSAKGVNRNEYTLGSQLTAGFGELVIKQINSFWLIYTTERRKILM